MIPEFDELGYLPPGEHTATWIEVDSRFGYTPWRKKLLGGLCEALLLLQQAGCRRFYLDGSFVTSKESPNDFDGCWDSDGLLADADLDPIFWDDWAFADGRRAQKDRFHGEIFIANSVADPYGNLFKDFFQRDRNGIDKGIIVIDLTKELA
jgi:hypothetical protein